MRPETDWPALLPAVLGALEREGRLPAETRKERGGEVRYGSRGSLSVDLRAAMFHDHEAGTGDGGCGLINHGVHLGNDRKLSNEPGPPHLAAQAPSMRR